MGVEPPFGNIQPSQPSEDGVPKSTNSSKRYQEARRRTERKKEEEKKEQQVQAELQIELKHGQQKAETIKTEGIKATEAKSQLISAQTILRDYVKSLSVGAVHGKEFLQAELKAERIPDAFSGAVMSVQKTEAGVAVDFKQMTPQQEMQALELINKNKDSLQLLVNTMSMHNMHLTTMRIGNHEVPLPPVKKVSLLDPTSHQKKEQGGQQGFGGEKQQQKPRSEDNKGA